MSLPKRLHQALLCGLAFPFLAIFNEAIFNEILTHDGFALLFLEQRVEDT
jgi:hypothetical protein